MKLSFKVAFPKETRSFPKEPSWDRPKALKKPNVFFKESPKVNEKVYPSNSIPFFLQEGTFLSFVQSDM